MPYSTRQIQLGFNRHAHEYDKHADLQHSVLFHAMRQLEPYFSHNMALLDAGCGTGFVMELFKQSNIAFTVYGCDIAPAMCATAAARSTEERPNLVACADLENLPFGGATMDLAVSSLTMQWVNRSEKALAEIYRVLKPGGRCLLTTFGPMTLQELREAFTEVDEAPHVSHFVPMDDLVAWAQSAGFVVESNNTEFRCHYYQTVKDLMREIRAIGASNRQEGRRKGFTGRGRFKAMEAFYTDKHETQRGIPASWEVLYLLLHKAE